MNVAVRRWQYFGLNIGIQSDEIGGGINRRGAESSVRCALDGTGDLADYQTAVIFVNDKILNGDPALVKEWFSDALDRLAEDLPVRGAPVVPTASESALVYSG